MPRPATAPPPLDVAAAVRGDPAARQAVVVAHGRLVWALCVRLADEPDDAWQSIWERVFRALPGFRPDGPAELSTWIRTIAHRHLVDRHRRGRTRGVVIPLDGMSSESPSPEAGAARAQTGDRLEAALTALPPEWRRLVVLHHVHGVPLPEIADAEGVPLGTLKSRLHRARGRLVQFLESR